MNPSLSLNENTIEHFSKLWLRNYFINLKLVIQRENTGLLFKESLNLKNKSVLFVGASPVLEDEINLIKKSLDKVFLISSDTSASFLLHQGVIPDLILSIDSGRGTYYHFRNIPDKIPILTWLGGCRYIFELKNPVLLYLSSFPLDQILSNIVFGSNDFILNNPSLNVSGLAKSLAIYFESVEFLLAGISFTSHKNKTHTRGTGYESYFLDKLSRKESLESYTPISYSKKMSKKNELAFYHLTDTSQINVKKINEFDSETVLYKNKIPSIRISESEKKNFLKILENPNVINEIKNKLQISKTNLYRYKKILKNL
jgi:hypothetical protein